MNPILAIKTVTALVLAVLVGVGVASPFRSGTTLKRIHDPGRVTYSIHLVSCHTQHRGQLPDRSCTPGSVDPAVTQANIGSTIRAAVWGAADELADVAAAAVLL